MKKALYLLVLAVTWYLAAMYRSVPLMALTVTEVLLFVGMFLLSLSFLRLIDVDFDKKLLLCRQGEEPTCDIHIRNRGILPSGVIRLQLRYTVEDRSHRLQVHVLGGTGLQVCRNVRLPVDKMHCGLFSVQVEKMYVYDYLTLFRRKKKRKELLQIAVLPKERLLTFQEMTSRGQEMPRTDRDSALFAGTNMDEIRQLREHQEGEPYRFIHWKQSARLDQLYVKEFYRAGEETVSLTLFPEGLSERSWQEKDTFYETLYSLLLGILEKGFGVDASFYLKEGERSSRILRDKNDCDTFFLLLYQTEEKFAHSAWRPEMADGLSFDAGCHLLYHGEEVGWYEL